MRSRRPEAHVTAAEVVQYLPAYEETGPSGIHGDHRGGPTMLQSEAMDGR